MVNAETMLQKVPSNTPRVLAKGTYRAKKNKSAIGTVRRFTVLLVTAMKLPGTDPITELKHTTNTPTVIAMIRAERKDVVLPESFGNKSVVTTAVMELIPESMLDIAAASRPETTNPVTTGGRSLAIK